MASNIFSKNNRKVNEYMKKVHAVLISLCTMISLVCTTGVASNVLATANQATSFEIVGETVNVSPDVYIQTAEAILLDVHCADELKIEAVCKTFLTMAKASVRDQDYDCTWFIAEDGMKDAAIQYHLSTFAFQNAFNNAREVEIFDDNISFRDFAVEIENGSATASIVEEYSYYLDEGFDDDYNYRMREYTFSLILDNSGEWRIIGMSTNDPWETEAFLYQAIDVESVVQAMLTPTADESSAILNEEPANTGADPDAASLTLHAYNAAQAIAYAEQWYNVNSSAEANPVFGFSSSNCQNFASQCIWAGLCAGTVLPTDKTAWPAVSTALVGSDAPNVWCRNQCTTYYPSSTFYYNWAWDNVGGFAKLIETSSTSRVGPVGTVRTGLSYASAGNEIAYATSGTPSSSNLNHAMFVTSVTGTSGSRGISNLKIAANTDRTDSAYMSLASYRPDLAASQYLTMSITSIAGSGSGDPVT